MQKNRIPIHRRRDKHFSIDQQGKPFCRCARNQIWIIRMMHIKAERWANRHVRRKVPPLHRFSATDARRKARFLNHVCPCSPPYSSNSPPQSQLWEILAYIMSPWHCTSGASLLKTSNGSAFRSVDDNQAGSILCQDLQLLSSIIDHL